MEGKTTNRHVFLRMVGVYTLLTQVKAHQPYLVISFKDVRGKIFYTIVVLLSEIKKRVGK